jgi:hypothetical protein
MNDQLHAPVSFSLREKAPFSFDLEARWDPELALTYSAWKWKHYIPPIRRKFVADYTACHSGYGIFGVRHNFRRIIGVCSSHIAVYLFCVSCDHEQCGPYAWLRSLSDWCAPLLSFLWQRIMWAVWLRSLCAVYLFGSSCDEQCGLFRCNTKYFYL